MYKKKIKLILLTLLWGGTFSQSLLSQVIITSSNVNADSKTTSKSADLILNSPDKSFLPNRVALSSLNSPLPLAEDLTEIQNGTIVYNTTTNLGFSSGLYLWQDNKWNVLLTSHGKKQDFSNLVYKQTKKGELYKLPYVSSNGAGIEIPTFTEKFVVPKDGTILISTLIYTQMSADASTFAQIGNTFFTIQITDITPGTAEEGTVTKFYAGCTPLSMRPIPGSSSIGINNNPTSATAFTSMRVIANHSYEVKVLGEEGWNQAATVYAGNFEWNIYEANSALKIDFQSDAY
ncbi:hypothetical protein ETU10_04110 [Apibacter muscae]|uniref:hypothetical protein n=1 Tax=Apibacter muscae TaxID=2509004 RepID=UPI0011ADCC4B|nr:hypothetical protein [Apibacter muscae]TWP24434.1 hypothetical protein ETU10_04110 [Apibacter muscae]